ncbi:MAG: prolyl oligopeptidase family serine peptidase [Bacteroidales bacterium]|jgi:prolyl oligopeptidase|nr:prolyl oligopeptidase family serine peptidase [Bacteroidales bacterium]
MFKDIKHCLNAVPIIILTFAAMLTVASCSSNPDSRITYPETKMGEVIDTIFGTPVADPYRWLEDDMSEETAAWVKAQNAVTFAYLERIPYREQIRERLTEMYNYEKYGMPFTRGDYTYFTKNDGLQNQDILYRQREGDEPEIFLDPNTFSADGTTSLREMGFSKDGSRMAYAISEGGSDWRKVITLDATTKEIIGDTLVDIKFSDISWLGNEGFFYSTYVKPKGSELSAMTDRHRLFYHKTGTPQSEDRLIFGGDKKRRYVTGYVTDDQRYLVVTASISTTGNELYIKDLSRNQGDFTVIVPDFDSESAIIESDGSRLFIFTNMNAPNGRVVTVDASDPGPENWVDFIPETENVLQPSTGAGYLFANYLKDAISSVQQYNLNGTLVREVELPGIGSAEGFSGRKEDSDIYFSFSNYTNPSTIYKLDPETGERAEYKKPAVLFKSEDYVSEQVFYTSKDGTRVPMIITHGKNVLLNGKNPTLLYGYGGFGVSETPVFSVSVACWLEMGGIYAVPNIRGGGEYGERWHLAGARMNKQNVFDDFIAAAEYLIENGYTSSEYLAVQGGSNGGLLIGAVMTQRPDLFRVALPAVGVLDMLRYHKFTAGAGWAYDYGTADESPEMFRYLLKYSPVQNVVEGTAYPATLVTTSDHDDRVVPAHSFKFASHLQAKQAGPNPVLIRIETSAGHGAGTPVNKRIEATADLYSFALWNMGIKKIR